MCFENLKGDLKREDPDGKRGLDKDWFSFS